MSEQGRTFILAMNRDDAIAWCRENDVKPYAKSTIILTTALACRGHEYRDGDGVVNLGWRHEMIDAWQNVTWAWRDAHPWAEAVEPMEWEWS